ncbi:MAG TPA: glycoside hydrolase family 47 protein [Holophagaceae bacterium]|nr:glycoside hydrolase family 47 protein [Holophagaceae bacterium]
MRPLTRILPPLLCSAVLIAQTPPPADAPMAAQVRAEALHAWQGYRAHAWGHDELRPLSLQPRDWYGKSLLMTPVDALDTLILMGLKDEAEDARKLIDAKLDFDQDLRVKGFEINIRLLGGLLSGYQLTGDPKLLALAKDLGDRLLPAFDTPTGMPYQFVNLKTHKADGAVSNPAEIGTYLLEFGVLSRLTKNPVYYAKAKAASTALFERRSKLGLVGSEINVETGAWTDRSSHISGGIDSYYEYLLKASILFDDADCARMWKESLAALNAHVADEAPTGLWYATVDMDTGKRTATEFGSLDAFFPATLALAGDLDRAAKLQASTFKMWTAFGIEPEEIDYTTMKPLDTHYMLRPEAIESAYYLHTLTGDPKYLAMGRTYFASLKARCRTKAAYAALKDVTTGAQLDDMESFFFAETLKYLYLLFAPPQTLDFPKGFVFNTEAHPFRRSW